MAQTQTAAPRDTVVKQTADSTIQGGFLGTPWPERRVVSTVLSALIPGSGQTYLGHTEKGAAFTLGTIACALVTGLTENNIVGRNERIGELRAQYQIATNYVGADTIWTKMVSTKELLDNNVKRRDIFLKLTVALWVANMVDVIFFSGDKGEKPFGLRETERGTSLAIVPDSRNGFNAVLTVRF
ncbi:MAG TPA: hypothetical protein DEP53_10175 [Bacteroidetes bacterium]|nr:hypothetical protein [Bacteroidota bacterium]